ncbi:cupin domain-containing protein [Amycolatopsis saalfeldensis]|uniref:Cupin superfamily protein n=1 Tax=Amycolatopsis saalfeldensis TaxID=394193 RepID=A0A1H8YQV5_9PSEU|nr:cupin domain-containing protein [Amycolatopsis saalfeldensis]SEP53738.1 Cupin superfamily protein [Amycolatopsis saalfeldensis]
MKTYTWPPSPDFWTDEFPAQTTTRTTPYLFKGIIPETAAHSDDFLAGFETIRRAHAAQLDIKAKARVYVGEDRRDDLLPSVLTAPAWDGASFVPWMQDLVGAERFSLVINNLETVSPGLAAGFGAFLRTLVDGWGFPLGGAEQVAFAGNYAGTAFGVHEGYEDAFLVHLGPNPKNFYTWPADEYEKLTGGKKPLYGDYQWLLAHGEHFVLEPGDALFLPRRVFHVGTQDQFSVSVAIPLYTYPHAAILRQQIIPDVLASLLDDRGPDDALSEPSPMAAADAGSMPVAEQLAGLGRNLLLTAADRVTDAAERHARQRWHTVLSNGGWELSANDLSRQEAAAAFDPQQVTPGATVSLIAPYQLFVTDDGVFLRGFDIDLDVTSLDQDTVAALNAGDSIALPADDAVLAAFRTLGATGGLRLTTHSIGQEESAS